MRSVRWPMRLALGLMLLQLALWAVVATSATTLRRGGSAAGSRSHDSARYSRVASLDDGPTELQRSRASGPPQPEAVRGGIGGWQHDFLERQRLPARYTEQQRLEHAAAAKAAFEYAHQYVGHNYPTGAQYRKPARRTAAAATDPASEPAAATAAGAAGAKGSAAPKFSASTYELIARAKEVSRQARLRRQQQQQQQQQQDDEHPAPPPFAFADAGAFVEEGVRLRSTHKFTTPYEKQEWTYSDTEAPPDWLVPDGEAKQGCPTTKPPPVPRMPPPPPPQPTPTWMSPFDEHTTPVFPHSSTPAPFYGMGPAPPSPPANYLPLDTFLSPKEDE